VPEECRDVDPVDAVGPAAWRVSAAQLVSSVSSISEPMLTPSPTAVAPDMLDAQLVGIVTTIVLARPAVAVAVKRASPWPSAWATKS
jgi:hypothetical protein